MKFFKATTLTLTTLATALFLTSCGDNKTAEQKPATEQTASQLDPKYAERDNAGALLYRPLLSTPSHLGVPEGVELDDEQVYRVNNYEDPETIDPSLSHYSDSFQLVSLSFDTLARQSRDGDYIPLAAESWETSEDGLVWTFHLRKEAKWQDGVPVTAKDFVYSWKRLMDPATAAPYAGYLALMGVKNAQKVLEKQATLDDLGLRAVDDYTLEVTLERKTPWLVQMLSLGVLVPLREDVITKYGNEWTKPENYVGNGAYRLKTYRLKDTMVYEKVADYWGANNVTLTRIEYDFRSDPNSGYLGYREGRYMTGGVIGSLVEEAAKSEPDNFYVTTNDTTYYFLFVPERVSDPKIRRAFALALDRETVYEKVLKINTPSYQFVPSSVNEAQYVKPVDYKAMSFEERVAEAQRLLTEAGYSKDKPLKLKFPTSDVSKNKTFIAINNRLKENTNGMLELDPVIYEGKAYYDFLKSNQYDLRITGWGPDYDHISTYTSIFTCTNPNNIVKYCNKDYDALLDKAVLTDDADERAKLYGQAVDLLQSDNVMVPLFYPKSYFLLNPRMQGYNKDLKQRYFQDYFFVKVKK